MSSDDMLSNADLAKYWPLVEKADREELRNFAKHDVFAVRPYDRDVVTNVIDMIWVRRWKRKVSSSGTVE